MATTVRGKRPKRGDAVIDRAFELLGAFDAVHSRLTLGELSRRSGIPLSSASRIAAQLLQRGALDREKDGRFAIGLRLYEMASLCPRSHGLREVAMPFMADLSDATGQHVLLAVRDGEAALLVERLSGHRAMPVLYRVGGRMPLHSTGVGLVLLAFAPAAVQENYLAQPRVYEPEMVPVPPRALRRALAEARRERVVVVRRQVPEATMAIAAPILNDEGEVVAALSVVVPDLKTDPRRLIPALRTTAAAISRGTGPQPAGGATRGSVGEKARDLCH
jgi:DNA-binding IclR family transcriptional regulator